MATERRSGGDYDAMNHNEIVNEYIRAYRDEARKELADFERESSRAAAIRRAALCETRDGKRHPHQRRIRRVLLERIEARLQAISRKLSEAIDFATLHQLIESEVGGVKGIGPLTVYDISHRIGAHFGKEPERVYLHAGSRSGAQAFNIKGDSVDPALLPSAFSRLKPFEIEDCLCIFKRELHDPSLETGAFRLTCGTSSKRRCGE
jgi:hypothetical protein